jgi:hypothetical protein
VLSGDRLSDMTFTEGSVRRLQARVQRERTLGVGASAGWFDSTAVAEMLGVRTSAVSTWVRRGLLTPRQRSEGRRVYGRMFRRVDVEAFAERRTMPPSRIEPNPSKPPRSRSAVG